MSTSDTAVTVRPFTDDDFEAVLQVWHEAKRIGHSYIPAERDRPIEDDRAYFRSVVAPHCELWVAEVSGEILGFLALKGSYIDRLYIRPDRQRTGVGTLLLRTAMVQSPAALLLHTHVKNTQARAFYEKHGFRAVRFGLSPAPENEPDVEYHWAPPTTLA